MTTNRSDSYDDDNALFDRRMADEFDTYYSMHGLVHAFESEGKIEKYELTETGAWVEV